MNRNYFKLLIAGVIACVVYSSCSKDDGVSGAPGTPSGSMVSDDEEATALLEGIRLSSVGAYKYNYDENGKFESMDFHSWSAKVENGSKITWEYNNDNEKNRESESYTLNISNNHIVSMSMKGSDYYVDKWGESSSVQQGNASFSYNAKGQLASISYSSSESGSEAGERYSGSSNGNITFNYSSDHRLLSIKEIINYNEDGERSTMTKTITCNYDSSPQINLFYQYTPNMFRHEFEELEGFMYLGLLGKASACIPSSYSVIWEEKYDDGESDSGSYSTSSSVSFNSNGTIHSADGQTYSYTNVGTRSIPVE